MQEITDPLAMRAWSRAARAAGQRVGLVPTMGFLHEGHLRLADRLAERCDRLVLSVFVNPLQFGPTEDFSRYPRDLARDRHLANGRGVHCLFVPAEDAMYRPTTSIRVTPGGLAAHLCGPWRPGHFAGVLTVVTKLFHIVEPDVAAFGRKDIQQARLIVRLVTELDFPAEIVVAPTVREADGLALSSRNHYLSPAERRAAVALSRGLEEGHRRYRAGTGAAARIVEAVREVVAREPALRVEYIEAVDPEGLAPVTEAHEDTILALAARLGATRLIDNIILGEGLAADERLTGPAGA